MFRKIKESILKINPLILSTIIAIFFVVLGVSLFKYTNNNVTNPYGYYLLTLLSILISFSSTLVVVLSWFSAGFNTEKKSIKNSIRNISVETVFNGILASIIASILLHFALTILVAKNIEIPFVIENPELWSQIWEILETLGIAGLLSKSAIWIWLKLTRNEKYFRVIYTILDESEKKLKKESIKNKVAEKLYPEKSKKLKIAKRELKKIEKLKLKSPEAHFLPSRIKVLLPSNQINELEKAIYSKNFNKKFEDTWFKMRKEKIIKKLKDKKNSSYYILAQDNND